MITSWKEMPLGTFIEVNNICGDKHMAEDDKTFRIAAICAGITYDEIMNMPLNETAELIKNIAFVYTEPKKEKMKSHYIINGVKYIPLKNYEDMTTAQYIDFQAISENINMMLGEYLAIFLIPEGHKYNDGYKSSDVAKDIYDYFCVEEALGIANFFTKQCSKSMKRTLLYLESEAKVMQIITRDKEMKEVAKQVEDQIKKARTVVNSICG